MLGKSYAFDCSVERILAYTNEYEAEKPAVVSNTRPPREWPSKGQITLDNLVVRYRPDLPPVLKGLSVKIQGGEKVHFLLISWIICLQGLFLKSGVEHHTKSSPAKAIKVKVKTVCTRESMKSGQYAIADEPQSALKIPNPARHIATSMQF